MATRAPYGSWASKISVEGLTQEQIGLGQPAVDGSDVFWIESRPSEGGRNTLIQRLDDGRVIERTPAPFNLRTRVHEYGGGAYAVRDGVVVGVDFQDQRLYRLQAGRPPVALTPESDKALRYADMAIDPIRPRLVAVREDHREEGEPVNTLVLLDLEAEGEGTVIASGHDFFACPRFSPDGRRIAWISWDHPAMPWDGTTLWLATIGEDGQVAEPRAVAGGPEESIVQPAFGPDGRLYFVSDRTGWWSLYRHEADGSQTHMTDVPAEFGGPQWVFGSAYYAFQPDGSLVGVFTQMGTWRLWRLAPGQSGIDVFDLPYTELSGIAAYGARIVVRAGAADRKAAILALDLSAGGAVELKTAGALPLNSAEISRPESIVFPTAEGREAHAFFYPPRNPRYEAPDGELPPLIVRSHGGPTSRASSEVTLAIQFWTSRGFAVVDVNYGGSTGFGRPYRNRLRGQWGVVDVEDCAAAAAFLASEGRVDPKRMAITGGSAGGYTTLCALTFTDRFQAGISRYGVSDLTLLAAETHKFESRYLDQLVGPLPEAEALYRERSPLVHAERLDCPVLFLQGLEDPIVPPNQAEKMLEVLRRKGVPSVYVAFEGEQHGFRKAETIHAAARAELAFLAYVFGFTPAEPVPELDYGTA